MFFAHLVTSFYHDFPVLFLDVLTPSAHFSARLQCDHLLWACLPSPLSGSLSTACIVCSGLMPVKTAANTGHLGSAEIAPWSVMKRKNRPRWTSAILIQMTSNDKNMTWIRTFCSHQTSIPASPKRLLKFVQVKTCKTWQRLKNLQCIPSTSQAMAAFLFRSNIAMRRQWPVAPCHGGKWPVASESTQRISAWTLKFQKVCIGLFCICFKLLLLLLLLFRVFLFCHCFCLEAFVAICLSLCRGLTNLAVKGCWTSQFLASKHFCMGH